MRFTRSDACYSAESVQETDFRRGAKSRVDGARHRFFGVQSDRSADAEAAMVQGRQRNQSGRHIRVDGQLQRGLSGRLHLRGDQRHGHRDVHVKDTGRAHAVRQQNGQVNRFVAILLWV